MIGATGITGVIGEQPIVRILRSCITLVPIVALCVGGGNGCVSRPASAAPSQSLEEVGATLVVRNHHWSDVRVYVSRNGRATVRLGIVPVLGASRFILPRLTGELQILVVPLGIAEPQLIEHIIVPVGGKLLLTVEVSTQSSSLVTLP